jgi:hypothetical protein
MRPDDFRRNKRLLQTRLDAGELAQAEYQLRLRGLRLAYREESRERQLARLRVKSALVAGRMVQPPACEVCHGQTVVLFAHHEDHGQPYSVLWACRQDHLLLDKGAIQ